MKQHIRCMILSTLIWGTIQAAFGHKGEKLTLEPIKKGGMQKKKEETAKRYSDLGMILPKNPSFLKNMTKDLERIDVKNKPFGNLGLSTHAAKSFEHPTPGSSIPLKPKYKKYSHPAQAFFVKFPLERKSNPSEFDCFRNALDKPVVSDFP